MSVEKNKREPKELSRREFLKDAGLVVGGAAIGSLTFLNACSGTTKTVTATATTTATQTITAIATTTVTATPIPTTTTPPTTTPTATTRTITDMFGRSVTVPAVINRVLADGPVEMELVYMLAPDKLAGLSFTWDGTPPYVLGQYANLPVVGGWFGTQTGNYETFIAAKPDVILEGSSTNIQDRQTHFSPIPVVGVNEGDLTFSYKAAILFLGDLLGVPQQAANLVNYYTDAALYVASVVSQIPPSSLLKVYYAEGKDGLSTDPLGSQHTALMAFCGGVNVANVQLLPGYGMATVSMEQILLWDPDAIVIGRGTQASVYSTVMTGVTWNSLRAVKNGKVYVRPDDPLSLMDGPPGPCQILGMYWLVKTLYPAQTTTLDLNSKIKEFYANYLHYTLTDAQVTTLLAHP